MRIKGRTEGFFSTVLYRPFSYYLTKLIAPVPITPNQITALSFIITVIGCGFITTLVKSYMVIGGVLILVSYILDHVDGNLARLRGITSKKGAWLDSILDRLSEVVIFFSLSYTLFMQTDDVYAWIYGFLAMASLMMTYSVVNTTRILFGPDSLKKTSSGVFDNLRKIGLRKNYLILGLDFHITLISVGIILNKILYIFWFFIIIQNLYWMLIFIATYTRKK